MEGYYQSIDLNEFAEWMFCKQKHPFTAKELDKLTSRLDIESSRLEKDDCYFVFYKKAKRHNITKFTDDWFVLDPVGIGAFVQSDAHLGKKAWKCDGFRGLIKLLDDI